MVAVEELVEATAVALVAVERAAKAADFFLDLLVLFARDASWFVSG